MGKRSFRGGKKIKGGEKGCTCIKNTDKLEDSAIVLLATTGVLQKGRDGGASASAARPAAVPRDTAAVRAARAAQGAADTSRAKRRFLSCRPGGHAARPRAAHAGRRRGKVSLRGDAEAAGGDALSDGSRYGELRIRVTKNFKKWRGGWRSLVGSGESPGERRRRYFPAKLPKCYLLPVTRERDVKPGWLMLKQKLRG